MLRFLILLALLFSSAPQRLCAQNIEEKPAQILPEGDNLLRDDARDDRSRKSVPLLIADVPLNDEIDQTGGSSHFIIGAVRVDDGNLLPSAAYNNVTESFTGIPATPVTLKELAKTVADHARSEGYIFASARIPAQSAKAGVVRVKLNVGTIDSVVVKGPKNGLIKRRFDRLQGGPGKKASIEKAISAVDIYPGISIGKISYRRLHGRGILTVRSSRVKDHSRVSLDNYGTDTSGPIRARLEVSKNSLLSDQDWLAAQILVTPADPNELTFASARYSHIISDSGIRAAVSGAAGRTRRSFDNGNTVSKSRSRFSAVTLSLPAIQSRQTNVTLNLEAAFLTVGRKFSNGRIRDDDIATVSASLTGHAKLADGRLAGGVAATQGVNVLGATLANDPNSSRRDGSAVFTKVETWMSWTRKLGRGFSIRAAAQGQVASRPLLSSHEIDLGGPRFGRGFDFAERSGDQGILASFELRKSLSNPIKHVSSAQIYLFGDGGYVQDLRVSSGGGSLGSAGGGLRLEMGKLNLGIEVAFPVKGQREFGNAPKINATIGVSF